MRVTIEITDDIAERIVRDELRGAYQCSDPDNCHKVDRKDFRKLRKAIRRVYRYYAAMDIEDDLD